jgi:tRNA dimethylallyltransferase
MNQQAKPMAVAIMGPTASGKTAAALAIAKEHPVEIISVDSALVYREMDIGTAKPSPEELASVPHHLIDIIDPLDAYSVMQFRQDAIRLVAEIAARGRLPLLVGGTMMYFKGLADGLDDLPTADAAVRARIDAEAARIGWPGMHARLQVLDPVTAARLAPNDAQRINRALEIIELSGKPMSALLAQRDKTELPFELLSFALEPSDRAVQHGASRCASTRCWAAATTAASWPRWRACAPAATCTRPCPRCAASATASPGNTSTA